MKGAKEEDSIRYMKSYVGEEWPVSGIFFSFLSPKNESFV